MTKKQPEEPPESLVHPDDREWISESVAAEVLQRAADGSKPIPWSQVEGELDEMDRLGDQNGPKIIAEQDGGVYLLDVGKGRGQICDTEAGKIWPAQKVDSILARGYWRPTDSVDTADVLALVKPV